jgi:hypothetical protein
LLDGGVVAEGGELKTDGVGSAFGVQPGTGTLWTWGIAHPR